VYEHVFVPRSVFDPADVAFLSGFVAGDGSFMIRENNAGASWCCALTVKLRADVTIRRSARLRCSSTSGGAPCISGLHRAAPRQRYPALQRSYVTCTAARGLCRVGLT
jgi:hypothetical protein